MEFPEELVAELLIRMPLKSVIKSKCVSKDWNKLISGDKFRRWYQSRNHNTCPTGFIYHSIELFHSDYIVEPAKFVCTSNIDKAEFDLFQDLQEFGQVVSSSKGLLLLSLNWTRYSVYDLLTKKNVMLLETLKDDETVFIGFISKEREQNCPENLIGNGSYLTYKVLFVRKHDSCKPSSKYEVETYSSESGKWHKSMMTAASGFCLSYRCNSTVIGGVLYWVDYFNEIIIAYNPEDPAGCAKLIDTPLSDITGNLTISGTQGGLLLCIKRIYDSIDVWVLGQKHEGGSYLDEDIIDSRRWTLIHRIGIMELTQSLLDFQPTRFEDCFEHVSLNPQDSSVIYLRDFMTNEFLSYNLKEKRAKTVISKGEGEGLKTFLYTINFEWPSWPCL